MKRCDNAGQLLEMEIIFEDNHLLVVNKPSGILTQPSGTNQNSLEQLCKNYLKEKYHKPGNVFLEAVHRIDKPVSGIVVFARTSKALSRLQKLIREKNCVKKYLAIVENAPPAQEGILEHYLLHKDHYSEVVDKSTANSKLARLHYRRYPHERLVLLEIELETGRYHQIRVQLSAMGCPILGDARYGSKTLFMPDGIALHHYNMTLDHPISNQPLSFQSYPPWI